jgi:hypothetical protein
MEGLIIIIFSLSFFVCLYVVYLCLLLLFMGQAGFSNYLANLFCGRTSRDDSGQATIFQGIRYSSPFLKVIQAHPGIWKRPAKDEKAFPNLGKWFQDIRKSLPNLGKRIQDIVGSSQPFFRQHPTPANHRLMPENHFPILGNDFPTLGNHFPTLGNVFMILGSLSVILGRLCLMLGNVADFSSVS